MILSKPIVKSPKTAQTVFANGAYDRFSCCKYRIKKVYVFVFFLEDMEK